MAAYLLLDKHLSPHCVEVTCLVIAISVRPYLRCLESVQKHDNIQMDRQQAVQHDGYQSSVLGSDSRGQTHVCMNR
jgi:hypothetical protein